MSDFNPDGQKDAVFNAMTAEEKEGIFAFSSNHAVPSSDPIMKYFAYAHLPEGPLRETSGLLAHVARHMDATLPEGAEKRAGLRKLLEAKDCFVRAALEIKR